MGKIIFITGPSGAGKSTVAAEVAARWPSICALLDFDKIRTLIKSGFVDPALGWNKTTEEQWAIAREVIASMARTYSSHNVDIVIEAFANPGDYSVWQKAFADIHYKTFVLMPPLDQALVRNNQRQGTAKLKAGDIEQNYEWSEGWEKVDGATVLENATDSPAQTADKIIALAS